MTQPSIFTGAVFLQSPLPPPWSASPSAPRGPRPWRLDSPPALRTRAFISNSCPQPAPPPARSTPSALCLPWSAQGALQKKAHLVECLGLERVGFPGAEQLRLPWPPEWTAGVCDSTPGAERGAGVEASSTGRSGPQVAETRPGPGGERRWESAQVAGRREELIWSSRWGMVPMREPHPWVLLTMG